MKRKILVTFALSTLFAASQLACLPTASAHAAPDPHQYAYSHVLTIRGKSLEDLLSHKTTLTLGHKAASKNDNKHVNSNKDLSDFERLEALIHLGS